MPYGYYSSTHGGADHEHRDGWRHARPRDRPPVVEANVPGCLPWLDCHGRETARTRAINEKRRPERLCRLWRKELSDSGASRDSREQRAEAEAARSPPKVDRVPGRLRRTYVVSGNVEVWDDNCGTGRLSDDPTDGDSR